MKSSCGRIYKSFRIYAGLGTEEAAEMLHVSSRSLYDYENDRTVPPNDVVDKMSEVYGAPILGYIHRCSQATLPGILPEIRTTSLSLAVIQLQNATRALCDAEREMLAIVDDGIVDSDEKPRWNQIRDIAWKAAGAAVAIFYVHPEGDALCEALRQVI